jgi:hypothetical protein
MNPSYRDLATTVVPRWGTFSCSCTTVARRSSSSEDVATASHVADLRQYSACEYTPPHILSVKRGSAVWSWSTGIPASMAMDVTSASCSLTL